MGPSLKPSALPKERLTELFDRLGLPPQGRQLVQRAMVEAPVREVTSSGRNVVTQYHSVKNNCWIGTESRHVEFPAAVLLENDAKVLAYYPQPFTRVFEHTDPQTGEIHTVRYTPDFLVLREDGVVVIECKPHQTLQKEAQRYPYKFRQSADGSWFSPLFSAELGKLGLRFDIFTDLSFSRVWAENCQHLADYLGEAAPACPDDVITRVQALLSEEGRMTLHELVSPPHNFSADDLNKAIVDGALVANLEEEPLYEPRCAWLYRDTTYRDFVLAQRDIRQPGNPSFVIDISQGARFSYGSDALTVAFASDTHVVMNQQNGQTFEVTRDWMLRALDLGHMQRLDGAAGGPLRFQDYSSEQLASAMQRKRMLDGHAGHPVRSSRTLSRYRAKQAVARAMGGNEYLALAPMTHLRGNRVPRLDIAVLNMMQRVYEDHWRGAEAKSYKVCHQQLQVLCAKNGLKAPSYPALINFIKRVATDADVRTRQSSRYAYQQSTFVDSIEYEAPVHGSRPLQFLHIDHTQIDLECISSRTGRPLGRPWLTLAVCATTRRIVGLYLSFDAPSYRSVMMVMRDFVRRESRMPEFVIVDNGADLVSEAFAAFLEMMGTHLRPRPKGSPRHGAVLERMFGRANAEYVHNLAGNTKATKQVRMVTGKSLPSNNAAWTLEALYHGLCFWAFEHYPHEDHPALGDTPARTSERLVREVGKRPQRRVLFNRDFLIATCPPVDRGGIRVVHRQTGVKVHDRHYWHPAFREVNVADTKVPVRFDPFDASSVYAFVKGQWIQARNRRLAQLPAMSEAALQVISEEYRSRFKPLLSEEQEAQRLREFMSTFTPEGATAANLERIAQNETLFVYMGSGPITPSEVRRAAAMPLNKAAMHTGEGIEPPAFDDLSIRSSDDQAGLTHSPIQSDLEDFDTF